MTKPSRLSVEPAAILSMHGPRVRATAEAVQRLVRRVVPEAEERGNAGWHSINFRHPEVGYFLGIFPFGEEVRVVFEWATRLEDPDDILEGETTRVKHVTLRSKAEFAAKEESLANLITQAIGLGNDRVPRVGGGRTRRTAARS
jgi:hypothetical protein